jgi:glycosyltransferase involved in cell wall biosynthesis
MIESMYYGCPVIGTPFGSLSELINSEVGFLSTNKTELVNSIKNIDSFNRKHIHEYFMENFTTDVLTENFLKAYERILNGEKLNKTIPEMKHIDPPEYFRLTD